MDETDSVTMEADDDDATTIIKVREAKAVLEDLTANHRSQTEEPPVSWLQRLLSWFRSG